MIERGIIFNAEMVRAILDGRKTQTRRAMKFQPRSGVRASVFSESGFEDMHGRMLACPFGEVGDRLWVRETFAAFDADWKFPGKPHDLKDGPWPNIFYAATMAKAPVGTLRPSIHMPRWASRITLEITDIRAERLQDISEDDAAAEGVFAEVWDQTVVAKNYLKPDEVFQCWDEAMSGYVDMDSLFRASFGSLWQSIYGEESWQANPWVWVVEFKQLENDGEAQ